MSSFFHNNIFKGFGVILLLVVGYVPVPGKGLTSVLLVVQLVVAGRQRGRGAQLQRGHAVVVVSMASAVTDLLVLGSWGGLLLPYPGQSFKRTFAKIEVLQSFKTLLRHYAKQMLTAMVISLGMRGLVSLDSCPYDLHRQLR